MPRLRVPLVPYGQQLVEPAGTRVLQRRQVAASAALYFPAGHGAQAAAAAAAELRNEPAGHGAAWAAAVMARSSAVWRMRRAVVRPPWTSAALSTLHARN